MGEPNNGGGRKGLVRVFISYSWDDDEHREWVKMLATRLRKDGVDARLDIWHTGLGDNTPEFMEREVRESDFILCICTPRYKERFDKRMGGVGYEAKILANEHFVNRNQRKFIPILRKNEWKESSPSLLMGTYFLDLRGDQFNEANYDELRTTLFRSQEKALTISKVSSARKEKPSDVVEFVNRKIELATLDPKNLHNSYWQYALINAPTGYGKTRLMTCLLETIENDPAMNNKWACAYVDISNCENLNKVIQYTVEEVTKDPVSLDLDERRLKEKICDHVHEKMSTSPNGGSSRHILLIIDSIDHINPETIEWFSAVLHDVIVDSYADYEKNSASFAVRVLIAGTDTETFFQIYQKWEAASQKYRLKPPLKLDLSAFDGLPVQEIVQRRSKKGDVPSDATVIQEISYELQYLSGGHPKLVIDILEELARKKARKYKEFFKDNKEQLIKSHVSEIARKVLQNFPLPQAQKDIKTVCVFRLINLNTLRKLHENNLVFELMDINQLGLLCKNNILSPPNADTLFYHDDIIRRILYLDLAHGSSKDDKHIQRVHQCAQSLYTDWMQSSHNDLHLFFVEWLFHSLQIATLSKETIISKWKELLTSINASNLPLNVIKRAISEKLNKDGEVKYLFRERFSSEDFSPLFES